MTYPEAIIRRISNRKYVSRPLSEEEISELNKLIEQNNRAGGLRFRLVTECPEVFSGLKGYGMFSGVRNLILIAGPESDPDVEEKCGYYGEKVVLGATTMGFGTCWVGGTYDKERCQALLQSGEKLCCVVTVGPVADQPSAKEKVIRGVMQRKSKTPAELSMGLGDAPAWFMSGIAAVQRAPSARNLQPVRFLYSNGAVTAQLTEKHNFSNVDLGIAKYHFEVGAHGGAWTWGDGGTFTKAVEEKSCGAVIWRKTENGHEYLLAQHGAAHWSFPKGHMEKGEKEADTAKREILEETGLTVELDTRFRELVIYAPRRGVIKDVVFFLATPTGGTEHPQAEEILQLGWFSYADALPLITFASDVEVLKAAENYIQSNTKQP